MSDLTALKDEEVLEIFKRQHQKRIDSFIKDNPGKPLPIFKTPEGAPVWLTRKERRKRGL